MALQFGSFKCTRDSKIWDFVSTIFGIFHIIDACISQVTCMQGPLKGFVVKGTLWSNVYGLSLLLLIVTVTAGVILIYGIFTVKTCLVTTYMILLGTTGIVTASLIAALIAIIGYNAFFMALLIRIPFHMIGLISAYYTRKRLKKIVNNNRILRRLNYTTQNNHNLETIHENLPPLPRPLYRRFYSEVKPDIYSSPREERSNSIV
ncbi:uncharacterized protein LOC113239707 [Hyposmocoma kahamanoa]|uniref:uncharacterized protein LOC113239707 n=1 Tax=Hyposmocoma kahamanoa TaxID=1477025 RepID=UPI000E6D9DAE|nr:uncharacterized protein LOC113239707 [Hyposmocoma kahamanoa]